MRTKKSSSIVKLNVQTRACDCCTGVHVSVPVILVFHFLINFLKCRKVIRYNM